MKGLKKIPESKTAKAISPKKKQVKEDKTEVKKVDFPEKKKDDKKGQKVTKLPSGQQDQDNLDIIDHSEFHNNQNLETISKINSLKESNEAKDENIQLNQESDISKINLYPSINKTSQDIHTVDTSLAKKVDQLKNKKNKSNLFVKMVNKKFDKQLFEHTSSESDNGNKEVQDKYRKNLFLNKDLQLWLDKTSEQIKKQKKLDYFASELQKKDDKEKNKNEKEPLTKQDAQKYNIQDIKSLQVASIDTYLLENHFLYNDHQENNQIIKMKVLEKHAVVFGYFIHARESLSQEKSNYMNEQQDLFLMIKQYLNGKIQKVMKKLDEFDQSNLEKSSFIISGASGTNDEQTNNFKNQQLELKYQISVLQNQKQDFLQRYKTSDDINYVDIAIHHQYIDIIFSEEYYKNEMDISRANQNIKIDIIESKGEEFWDQNQQQHLFKHQNKKELLSKKEQYQIQKIQLQTSEKTKVIINEIDTYTKWTLRTETPFFKFWNILLMLNGFYSTIAYLMYTVRIDYPSFQEYELWGLYACEAIFFIDIILSLFKQKLEDDGKSRQDNLKTTAFNYIFSINFALDFIAFVPFGYFLSHRDFRLQFFWILKIIRTRNLYFLFSNQNIFPLIEQLSLFLRTQNLQNEDKKYDNTKDRNLFKQKIGQTNIYKMIRLFIWIVCIGFIAGQVFYIYSNDIYMYEQNVQKADLYQSSSENITNNDNLLQTLEDNNQTSDSSSNSTEQTNTTDSQLSTDSNSSLSDNSTFDANSTEGESQIPNNTQNDTNNQTSNNQKRNLKNEDDINLSFNQITNKNDINNIIDINQNLNWSNLKKKRNLKVQTNDNFTLISQQKTRNLNIDNNLNNINKSSSNLNPYNYGNSSDNQTSTDQNQNTSDNSINSTNQNSSNNDNSTSNSDDNQTNNTDQSNIDNLTNSSDQGDVSTNSTDQNDSNSQNSSDSQSQTNNSCSSDSSNQCQQDNITDDASQPIYIDYYASKFNIDNQDTGYQLLINTYFIFSTFSRTGFGDYYPVSVAEKWIFIIFLLFTVFLFSYISGAILNMIKRYSFFEKDFYEDTQLDSFFALIRRFNMFKSMESDQKALIVETIKFRWEQNRNNFISTNFDKQIFNNLPENLMRKIYTDFIFKDFLKMFRRFLSFSSKNLEDQQNNMQNNLLNINISKMSAVVVQSKNIFRLRKKVRSIIHVLRTFRNTQNDKIKHIKKQPSEQIQAQISRFRIQIENMDLQKEKERKQLRENFKNEFYGNQKGKIVFPYLSYENDEYQNFVIQLLQSLEIRKLPKGYIIANELDECHEILFVISGKYNVGYDINRKTIYRKQFGCQTIIGAFQMSFNRRFQFFYQVSKEMICYSVSRKNWISLKQNYPSYYKLIKEKSLQIYNKHIYRPLMILKNKDIRQYQNRKDYQQILASKDSNFDFIRQCLNEMKKESIQEIKKRKFQKIDQIKINWLISTIEEKLQNYFQIAYQMTQRQEFMRNLLWEKITLALSKNPIENPQRFVQEFRQILVQGVSNRGLLDINLTYEEKKLQNMQKELMKQSFKMFAENHYRRILNQMIQEKISASQFDDNNYQYNQESNGYRSNFDGRNYQLSQYGMQSSGGFVNGIKRFKSESNQFSQVDERTNENVEIDSENSNPININRNNLMNVNLYSAEDSNEHLLVQNNNKQLGFSEKKQQRMDRNQIKHSNDKNYDKLEELNPIVIQQNQIDYDAQNNQRTQQQFSKGLRRQPDNIQNDRIQYSNQLIDYDADHEEIKQNLKKQKHQIYDQQYQFQNRQIQTPPDRPNYQQREINFQNSKNYLQPNEQQLFIRTQGRQYINSQQKLKRNNIINDY